VLNELLIRLSDPYVMENCAVRGVQSFVLGGAFGFMFGAFFGSMGTTTLPGPEYDKMTWKQALADGFKGVGKSGWSMAKNFSVIGVLFSSSECVIAKFRGKSDLRNTLYAGCFSGAVLARGGGFWTMGLGCAGFAAFSLAIDYFLSGLLTAASFFSAIY